MELFTTIKVPGFSSKSDGTFHKKKCPVILSSLHFFSDSFGKLFAVWNFSMIKVPGHFKFFAIIISSLRFFSDTFSKFFAVRYFSTIKVSGHFKLFANFSDSLVSSLRVRWNFSNDKSSWSLFHFNYLTYDLWADAPWLWAGP